MNLFPEHIRLKGKKTTVSELISSISEKSGWEKEWIDFLVEWYSPDDSIKVQTSGSTGTPKTVRLTKTFVAASAVRTLHYFGLKENCRVLHCLPSRFIAGKLMIVRALLGNLDMHVADPSTGFRFLAENHFHFAAMVPNQVLKIMNQPDGTKLIENIDQLLIGGANIPMHLENKLQQLSTNCYSSYGMTETATHIAIRNINGSGADRFYHCMEGIKTGLSAAGCLKIFIEGQSVVHLQTTDLAEIEDEKTFRILGRADNVIISGGLKFSPEQLENKLEPFIDEPFMISSLPHKNLGEQIILIIEGKENPETANRIKEICLRHLDKYEQPRDIRFVSDLPRTPNGKIDRSLRHD